MHAVKSAGNVKWMLAITVEWFWR